MLYLDIVYLCYRWWNTYISNRKQTCLRKRKRLKLESRPTVGTIYIYKGEKCPVYQSVSLSVCMFVWLSEWVTASPVPREGEEELSDRKAASSFPTQKRRSSQLILWIQKEEPLQIDRSGCQKTHAPYVECLTENNNFNWCMAKKARNEGNDKKEALDFSSSFFNLAPSCLYKVPCMPTHFKEAFPVLFLKPGKY